MASRAESQGNKAFRLGRSSLTGQYVLKPVGIPSKQGNRFSEREGEFSAAEARVLSLASRRISNLIIAYQLGLSASAVSKVIVKAKRRYGTNDKVEAARKFKHEMAAKSQAKAGSVTS
jgi:DNA-binding CsgD family transcriptional regulator